MTKQNKSIATLNLSPFSDIDKFFYTQIFEAEKYSFQIRMASLGHDVRIINNWLKISAGIQLWELPNTISGLCEHYNFQITDSKLQLFTVLFGNQAITFFEVFPILKSNWKIHYNWDSKDYGIRVLFIPQNDMRDFRDILFRNFKENILKTIIGMLFGFSAVKRVFIELDERNIEYQEIAINIGFKRFFLKQKNSGDSMNLYILTK